MNDAKKRVDDAMSEVQTIITELTNLQDINSADLDRLEQKLIEAENKLRDANLSGRIASTKDFKNLQQNTINDYRELVKQSKEEVENIKAIAEALPEECFKNVRLEI